MTDEILNKLRDIAASVSGNSDEPEDAIDRVLKRPARVSNAVSLRDSQVVRDFEQALVDAEIKQDVVLRVLDLVHTVLPLMLAGGV